MKSPKKWAGIAGRQPMVDKQRQYAVLMSQGVSNAEACRRLKIDRKTGTHWKLGRNVVRDGIVVRLGPAVSTKEQTTPSLRYLSVEERIRIADGVRDGRSARAIAADLGRAVSTVAREIKRNAGADGEYRPHAAQAMMQRRRPRPKPRRLQSDDRLRELVQRMLDQRWSPEQVVQELRRQHGLALSVETLYQALYCPSGVVRRDPSIVLRTKRPYRKPRRRGDARRPRFVVPIRPVSERPAEVLERRVPGHWEGDLIVGAFNRSAIATLVERTTRYTALLHLGGGSRADMLRDGLTGFFGQLPAPLRQSLTWDQGTEMCHHHAVEAATDMRIYFCNAGCPWQRPTNENTNGLLRDYFPKGTDLSVHSPAELLRVGDELNRRPRETLNWQTPYERFNTLRGRHV